MGGISMNRCLSGFSPVVSTDPLLRGSWNAVVGVLVGSVWHTVGS